MLDYFYSDFSVIYHIQYIKFNTWGLGNVYICQWNGSSLVEIMACLLFGAKFLPEPILVYYRLEY